MQKIVAFDFETHLISPETLFPAPICVTVATMNESGEIESFGIANGDADFAEIVKQLFESGHLLIGQNVSFDIGVAARAFPDLQGQIWQKLEDAEIVDIRIREMLANLATHGKLRKLKLPDGSSESLIYDLQHMVLDYLGEDLSDDKMDLDSWRYRYSELDGVEWDKFPSTARSYAQMDAIYALQIYAAQEKRFKALLDERDIKADTLAPFQTAVDFALSTISDIGMKTDPAKVHEVEEMLNREFHAPENVQVLLREGILRPATESAPYANQIKKAHVILNEHDIPITEDVYVTQRDFLQKQGIKYTQPKASSINTKLLKQRVKEICEEHGFPLKLTKKKDISTDKEVLMSLAPVDDAMAEYQHRMELHKLVSTELPALYWQDEVAERVFFNYNILVETGRTSSYGNSKQKKNRISGRPACNGQQRDPRIRPCFVSDPDRWILSVDFSALELVSTAQATYNILGYSKHRDKINDGYDLHSYLGGQLALFLHEDFRTLCIDNGIQEDPDAVYDCFLSCKKHSDDEVKAFFKHWRKFAKPVGLGYPGGLGARTFLEFAKGTYKVDVAAIAADMDDDEFEITSTLLWHAKRMGITEDNFRWTRYLKALALAIKLREIWLETYPEMGPYFKHITEQCQDPYNKVVDRRDDGTEVKGLCYTTPLGMHRAACTFTKTANGIAMQSPSAEGFKIAIFNVTRACEDPAQDSLLRYYGCKVLNEIHDELLLSVPGSRKAATECAKETQRLMEESMAMVIPDVNIGTEACLMTRWYKQAEPVIDADGYLIPWEPKGSADAKPFI